MVDKIVTLSPKDFVAFCREHLTTNPKLLPEDLEVLKESIKNTEGRSWFTQIDVVYEEESGKVRRFDWKDPKQLIEE